MGNSESILIYNEETKSEVPGEITVDNIAQVYNVAPPIHLEVIRANKYVTESRSKLIILAVCFC